MDDQSFQLENRIRRIEEELQEVKMQLRRLESYENTSPAAEVKQSVISSDIQPTDPPAPKKERMSLEQTISNWLPRLFIFVFILGIIWAFIAAMDRGWISPLVRVLTGFGVAGVLYWLGHRQYQQTRNALSIVLLGGSIVVYIAAVFAGDVLYEIIPYFITLIMLGAGIAAGVWMSRKYASESLLAVIGIGAYLYPFLFAGDRGSENLFYLYETLIFIGLVFESIRKQYKFVWNIANYAFIFAVIFFAITGVATTTFTTFLTLAVQQLVIIFLTFQVRNATSKEMYISAISIGAFFLYLIGEDVFGPRDINLYIFYLVTAGFYGGLSLMQTKNYRELKNVFFVFSMFYIFVFISQLFNEETFIRLMIYVVQAAVIYYLSQKRKSLFGTVGSFVLLLPVISELFDLPGFLLTFTSVICWLLIISLLLSLYIFRDQSTVLDVRLLKKALPYLIAAIVLVFFSKLSGFFTYQENYMYHDIGLSISWMIFVAFMYMAYSFFQDKHWQYIGLAFLLITLGKIILYDLATVDIVWRAILFIGLGTIGLFISRIFYNKKGQEN